MPRRTSFSGRRASAPSAVTDSKPTSSRMAIVDWNSTLMKVCGMTTFDALAASKTCAAVAEPVDDEDDADREQRHDLDHVDHDRRHRRAADAAVGDVAGDDSEDDAHRHQLAVVERLAVGERRVDVPEQGAGEGHHDAGVHPVVEMADPARPRAWWAGPTCDGGPPPCRAGPTRRRSSSTRRRRRDRCGPVRRSCRRSTGPAPGRTAARPTWPGRSIRSDRRWGSAPTGSGTSSREMHRER